MDTLKKAKWKIGSLNEIAEVTMGQSPPGSSYNNSQNGVGLINGPTEFTSKYPVVKQWTTQPTKLCKTGDILLCVRGSSTGRMNISNGEYCIGRGVASISGKEKKGITEFVYYLLEYKISQLLKMTAGSTFPNLSSNEIKDMVISIPNLEEQQKIAKILSTWDKAIELKEKLIEQKKEQKKGLMQKLLTGEVRLPGFEGEWKLKKLKSLCSKIMDGTHTTPKYTETGIPFYSVENVTRRDFTNHKYISEEEHLSISSRCKVEKGDILMTRIGSIGDAILVDWDHESSIYVSLALIKTNKTILSEYLVQYMGTHEFKKDILSKSLLSAVPQKINLVDIGNVNVYFPQDISEQKAIVDILSNGDKEIYLLEKELESLKQQKKGLMQLLLTGKVRVKA
ncbi:restriction endonuclease subunit S [Aneurinibacillus danicus]|uniref:Putative type I site-specific deoxyribonuclease n=1 Tax=Aneurinibacillus danicus TaxID=267746 RepID=A0A511VHC5_9BACL|nr:restriction endonuclease subunit S [Aneurinibacillus danicus]GEN36592.1 putative type I site-specific deoxyribonuclease [Aneurinibacillus danicus]